MPNKAAKRPNAPRGTRLWLRERKGRAPVYIIRETGRPDVSTGTGDLIEAETALAEHIQDRGRWEGGSHDPSRITVAEILDRYAIEHAVRKASPERVAYAIDALVPFWGELPLDAVRAGTCRRYERERLHPRSSATRPVKSSTIRRELGVLNAAIQHCYREGYITRAPAVSMPPPATPKRRWLTVPEAARLLRATNQRHIARFILIALYTGTRKDAILNLRWAAHDDGGWIDLNKGIMHRKADTEAETNKRRPPVRLPAKLLAHAQRWHRDGADSVIHYGGLPMKDIKTSWGKTVRRAGLVGVTPHTLKHTSVTWAMQAGVPIDQQAQYFGTSMAELQRTYIHHHPDHQRFAADAMNRRAK